MTHPNIHSYSWLPTQSMLADVLTKEMKIPQDLEDVIPKNENFYDFPNVKFICFQKNSKILHFQENSAKTTITRMIWLWDMPAGQIMGSM